MDDDDAGMSQAQPPRTAATARTVMARLRDALMVLTLVIFGLWAGSGFLIPLVLAVFVFILIIALSERIRALIPDAMPVPGWLTTLAALLVVLGGLFAVMYILGNQATQFARAIPAYEAQLESSVTRLVALIGDEAARIARDSLAFFDMSWLARNALGGARSFLSTFFLICLYVAFMLAERGTMSRKVLLAAGSPELARDIEEIMHRIIESLQVYVGVKTFVSALTALIAYAIITLLGLEYAETWAVLTFLLNFIPSIGSIVAVVFPALVALVQFDTITPFLVITFGLGSVQFLIGNFLDPAMMGRSLNLSTLVVILALMLWTSVWGLIGALLSTPLTVCVLVILNQVPALRPIAVLMSKDGTVSIGRDDPAAPKAG